MHYYKRNIGNYYKRAGRLSMLQHGALTLLHDACYDREQFPTLDDAIDWTWASSKEETEAVEFVLSKFFTLTDGVYVQDLIKTDIDKYQANAKTNRRIALEREANRRGKQTDGARTVDEPCTDGKQTVDEAPPNKEPITTNQEPETINLSTVVFDIFSFWKDTMKKNNSAKLTAKRKKCIEARLKEKYSVEFIKQAIVGCTNSPHHMGQNDQGTVYDDLTLICRSGDKLEWFATSVGQFTPTDTNPPSTTFEKRAELSNQQHDGSTAWADDGIFE